MLTSGHENTAIEGISNIKEAIKSLEGVVEVMAGSGVSSINTKELCAAQVDAIHFSIRKMVHQSDQMGKTFEVNHDKIKSILNEIN